jgi:hypothetical protein
MTAEFLENDEEFFYLTNTNFANRDSAYLGDDGPVCSFRANLMADRLFRCRCLAVASLGILPGRVS